MTALERAIVILVKNPNDPTLFATVLERFSESELFLALDISERSSDLNPKVVYLKEQEYVAVYDTELRLEESVGGGAEYLALSGRVLIKMLADKNTGVALNPGTAAIGYIFEPATLQWLVTSLDERPEEMAQKIIEVRPPAKISSKALDALSVKLTSARGFADYACLVEATDILDNKNPLLCFVGSVPNSQPNLAKLVNEYLQFSDHNGETWDVTYLDPVHGLVEKILNVGLRFDLPQPEPPVKLSAPGSIKGKPPILR